MTPDLLVCPGCRQLVDDPGGRNESGRLHLRRLDLHSLERAGDLLVCQCGRRYPVIDGVPIVVKDPGFLRNSIVSLIERDLPVEVAGVLASAGPDDAPYPHLLEHLSVYLDAHWGDRAEPAPEPGFALAPFIDRIAGLPRVAAAVELGCSVGRVLAAVPAELVIGLDIMFGAVRRARHLLAGERLTYARRAIGRHYSAATITPIAKTCTLLCADALDPPLVPEAFDRVIALNVLDSVAQPLQLLAVIDGLCAPGGEIIVSSPYSWRSSVMAEDARLGGSDPAADLIAILHQRRYAIEDEAEIAWTLRRDARSNVGYRTHYIRARKGT